MIQTEKYIISPRYFHWLEPLTQRPFESTPRKKSNQGGQLVDLHYHHVKMLERRYETLMSFYAPN